MEAYEVPTLGNAPQTIHRSACVGLLVSDLVADLDAKPSSASRRFRVARRRRGLGGGLLAERHHERVLDPPASAPRLHSP